MADFTLSFQNEHTIYEQNIKCTVKDYEFNCSYNPSLLQSGSIKDIQPFATSSSFSPYVTALGIYNDANELLGVAKFAKPIPISQKTDTTFLIRIDR